MRQIQHTVGFFIVDSDHRIMQFFKVHLIIPQSADHFVGAAHFAALFFHLYAPSIIGKGIMYVKIWFNYFVIF